MMIYKTHVLEVPTRREEEMIDVTRKVEDLVKESNVTNGQVVLFVPHTTAAITINENADPDVKSDMLYGLRKVHTKDKNFHHFEGNSHAHIKSSIIGVDQTILIEDSKLLLGTWQGLYFMEFDGGRTRKLIIRINGE